MSSLAPASIELNHSAITAPAFKAKLALEQQVAVTQVESGSGHTGSHPRIVDSAAATKNMSLKL